MAFTKSFESPSLSSQCPHCLQAYTSQSVREASRVYQDYLSCGLHTNLSCENFSRASLTDQQLIMDVSTKLRMGSLSKVPHIAVVGAGVSGLRCADILLQHGLKVTVLEARSRIGGRLHQMTLPTGQVVDLGANWIHGTDANPILELAKKTNTETHSWPANSNLFNEDGIIIDQDESNLLGDTMWGIVLDAFKYSNAHSSDIDINDSLYHFFCKRVKELYPGDGDNYKRRYMLLQMSEMWGAFIGSPVARQSLKFFWLEECLEGENLFCAGTYQKILAQIAEPALKDAEVKLLTKVTKVTSVPDKVTLTTDRGDELDFDEVVMTTPLGWLKKNKQTFDPPLPDRFSAAIDQIGYGALEKVYVTFPKAYWLKEGVEKVDQPFAGFGQWIHPSYSLSSNPSKWNQEVVEMATLPGSTSHPTLLFYIYGDQSHHQAAKLAELHTQEEQNDYLIQFYKPYYSRLPNYVEGSKDCIPESALASSWLLDDLAGNGSYCNFQIGMREADKDIEILREGLPGRSIWFAGEHTSPFVALGTVTGAYWSGEAVGKKIAHAYGKVAPEDTEAEDVNLRGFPDNTVELDKA